MKEKKSPKIAIVGGGPAAISLCMQLLQECELHLVRGNIEISVFEKGNEIGPGLPYASKEETYILNLPKDVMEPLFGQTRQFSAWLKTMPNYPRNTNFPPRYYFGLYLKHLATQIQDEAESLGIKITYLTNNEIISIQKDSHGQFQLESKEGKYKADYVALCTGHMASSAYSKLIGKSGYQHNPWADDTYTNLDPNEDVGVIGTRLTAIDVTCKLFSKQHKGKITLYSRSGLLPSALAKKVPPYPLQYLTLNNLSSLTRLGLQPLKLDILLDLFWKEISAAEKSNHTFESIVKTDKDITPVAWLTREIKAAEAGPRPWQQVLFSLYPIIPSIWDLMNIADQRLFLEKYYSTYMSYLAVLPLDNAHKIKSYLESGQLKIQGGLSDIEHDDKKFSLWFTNGEKVATTQLINATGPSYDPTPIPLCRKMFVQGIASAHPLGGINVNPQTLQVVDIRGNLHAGLFAIGELTHGVTLARNEITTISFQARQVATSISHRLFTSLDSHSRHHFFTPPTNQYRSERQVSPMAAKSSRLFTTPPNLHLAKATNTVVKGLYHLKRHL